MPQKYIYLNGKDGQTEPLPAKFVFFAGMENELTDKAFWAAYWESKKNLAFAVPPDYTFHAILEGIIGRHKPQTAVELGGFPGYYAVFLKKYFGLQTTLFDFYIYPPALSAVLAANGLGDNAVGVIEGDLFTYQPEQQYDLVLSCGLIEHFQDTKDVISRHLKFLRPGGTLLLTLPNFRGLNGWVQRQFDRGNYDKHHIASMDPAFLTAVCRELGLKDIDARFEGQFSVWLEDPSRQSLLARAFVGLLWLGGKIVTRVGRFESRQLSPYIVVTAQK